VFHGVVDMDKVKKVVTIFELPRQLGILQYVEYEPQQNEKWCFSDWCPHEGVLIVEGCKKGICLRYKVLVQTKDKRQWVVPRKKKRDEDEGGCLKPQVASALLELAEMGYEVGVWYERVETGNWLHPYEVHCGVVVNGIRLYQPYCRTVEECVQYIILDYRQEEKSLREPPPPDPVEELLKEYPELSAFGKEWIERFVVLKDRLIEIANVLHRFPWMIDVIQGMKEKPSPYAIFVLMAKDGSDAYLTFDWQKAYRVQNGVVKEVQLELERGRYEEYGKKVEVYRPKGLLAFAATAKEYVRVL
jgi:hypothetical protein